MTTSKFIDLICLFIIYFLFPGKTNHFFLFFSNDNILGSRSEPGVGGGG